MPARRYEISTTRSPHAAGPAAEAIRASRIAYSLAAILFALLLPLLSACSSGLPAGPTPTSEPTPTAAVALAPSTATAGGDQQSGAGTAGLQVDADASVAGNAQPAVGAAAPDFSLPALDGKTYSLSAQRGKVVVLEFLATWCPHCQDDAAMMNQLDSAYKSKGVQIFGINATPDDHTRSGPARMADLQWFNDQFHVAFPLLFDTRLKSANDYGVYFYPSIFMVDRQGKVGFVPPDNRLPSYDLLSGQLDKLLNQGIQ